MLKFQFVLVYFSILIIYINSNTVPIVRTSNGLLQGKFMVTDNGKKYQVFLGIPFAAKPIGALRFMPPEPPQTFKDIKNATEEGNSCIQMKLSGNEDCLYLNVFAEEIANENHFLPVMVYIHGGGFYGGSASTDFYGPDYFMNRGIVLVTIQYRLGVFGFLSNEDSVIPGNQGLKDQQMALQWVQENIKSFGGDPSKVTIFGNSAGSASVHLHMLSSKSRSLFTRAISQSGTALSAFAFIGEGTSKNITRVLAQNLECLTNSSSEMLKCLQHKSAQTIQQEYSKLQNSGYKMKKVLYRPLVEPESSHAFLTKNPLTTTSDKPWLVGIVRNEGLWKIHMPSLNNTRHLIQTEFNKFLPNVLFFEDTCSNPNEVAEKIYNFYFNNTLNENETIISLEQVISDSYFFWPTFQALAQHRGQAYCYLFDHRGERSVTELYQAPRGFGVSHMDELLYLFPRKKIFTGKMKEADYNISKLLVDLWINFAKEGNPTPKAISKNPQCMEDEEKITWEASINGDLKFFKIETYNLSMVKNIFLKRMNFWKDLPIRDKVVI